MFFTTVISLLMREMYAEIMALVHFQNMYDLMESTC
jgi:hypothetical protein